MWALVIKEFRELARDRRTLAMLVALPILLLVIFGYAANFTVDRVTVVVIGADAEALTTQLIESDLADDLEILRTDATAAASQVKQILREQEADAVIVTAHPSSPAAAAPFSVYLDGSRLFTAQSAQQVFTQLVNEINPNQVPDPADPSTNQPASGLSSDPQQLITVLFNPDLKTAWVMVPGLIGLILLFIGALITSIGLVRERESGTLEQLAVMPLLPSAIILGKIAPYFLLAVMDMAVVTVLGILLFGVPFEGSIGLFALAAVLFLLAVLGIGVLISSISSNTGQAIQLAILFVVPQVLLSGLIFPLESMPAAIRLIAYALPLTWFREISQGVMLRGAELQSMWIALVILAAMAALAFSTATIRMRHLLVHGGANR